MNRKVLWSALVIAITVTGIFISRSASRPIDLCRKELHIPSMGTVFEIQYVKSCGPDALGPSIKQKLERWETSMSLYQSQSEISRLNKYGVLEDPSPDFLRLLSISTGHARATQGYFDITIWPVLQLIKSSFKKNGNPPNRNQLELLGSLINYQNIQLSNGIRFTQKWVAITLDGIAKGFAVDEIGLWLQANGIRNFLINFSGNMLAKGLREDGKVWTVGIPNLETGELITIELDNQAVASSGIDYASYSRDKKWHHLINPHTLRPVEEVVGTSVIGPSATTCDVLSTALFVMGKKKAAQIMAKNYQQYKYWIYTSIQTPKTASN